MSGTVRRAGSPSSADLLPRLLLLEAEGLDSPEIAERVGLSARAVRNALQTWHERHEEEAPPPPLSILPRRMLLTEAQLMPPPLPGRADLPGYDAWQAIHVEHQGVRQVMRRMGLRFPSDVFALLAQHKQALEAAAGSLSAAVRSRAVILEIEGQESFAQRMAAD